MPKVSVFDMNGKQVAETELSDAIFGIKPNEAVMHAMVVNYLANQRQGTQSTLTRTEVRGGGRKPWRQKGTGRARSGTTSSPVWVGGGRAFPNTPDENFSHKVNRKMYRAGISAILSKLVADGRLVVANEFTVETPKTKSFVSALNDMSLANEKTLLVVVDELTENLYYGMHSFTLKSGISCFTYSSSYNVSSGFMAFLNSSNCGFATMRFSYMHHKTRTCPPGYPYYNIS